jgi:SAM-dependent methyltransferase
MSSILLIDQIPESEQWSKMTELWDANALHDPITSSDLFCFHNQGLFEEDARRITAYLVKHLKLDANSHLLDLGGGMGRIAKYLAPQVAQYTLADISLEMLKQAQIRLKGIAHVRLIHLKRPVIPCEPGSFDCCIAVDLFQHLPQPTLREYFPIVTSLLKPNGQFLFTTGLEPQNSQPKESDLKNADRLLGLLGLKTLPFGLLSTPLFEELINSSGYRLAERGKDFPGCLPFLPFQIPFTGYFYRLRRLN